MIESFVARHREEWVRLEALLAMARKKRVGALSAEQIIELGYLYRRVMADLAVARRDFAAERATAYLNQLAARAHAVIYRSEAGEWRQAFSFFARGFPALFREALPFTLAAFSIFALLAVVGFAVVSLRPDSAAYLVPAELIATVKEQKMWTEDVPLPPQLMASAIMINNIKVALFAFAGGALFGLATFYVLVANGLLIGATGGLCQTYGLSLRLWSFVAPHGVIELTVIFIAGGAGLRLGRALLHPSLLTRRQSLMVATSKAVKLLFGCVPLLVIAGTVEGFISPSSLSPLLKIAIGALSAVLLYGYLFFAGRESATASYAPSALDIDLPRSP